MTEMYITQAGNTTIGNKEVFLLDLKLVKKMLINKKQDAAKEMTVLRSNLKLIKQL